MSVEVIPGIPVPAKGNGRRGKSKYPFAEMRVGDSFFVAGAKPSSLQSMARRTTRHLGYKFTTRAAEHLGEVGARCWRKG